MNSGIYRLKWGNGMYYYGSSTKLSNRKSQHFHQMRKGTHGNYKVLHVYKEYGLPEFEILLTCDKEDLHYYEGALLKLGKNDPNSLNIDDHPTSKGRVNTDEYKKKMSESCKGRVISEETREKLRLANLGEKNPMFGRMYDSNHQARKVINTETMEVYGSLSEVVDRGGVGIKRGAFQAMLSGTNRNPTPYEYLDVYEKNGGKRVETRQPLIKKVINTETGEIYRCAKDILSMGLVDRTYSNFKSILSGGVKTNPTPYEYLDFYEANGNKRREKIIKDDPRAKKVINTQTLEVYKSAKEVITSGSLDMNYGAFKSMMSGKTKTNRTPFMYLENYENQNDKYEDTSTQGGESAMQVQHPQ